MSSPITAKNKGRLDRALIAVHRKLSHDRRVEALARRISAIIGKRHAADAHVRCLDVGCGDMTLAERIAELAPNTRWTCIDVHELPEELRDAERWKKYRRFDGVNIPFPDGSFDVVLFADVLHHVRTDVRGLLAEAGRAGRSVLVKDHFEYSVWSRLMLWIMDFAGNWGYGVALPKRYFSREDFGKLAAAAGLSVALIDAGIDLYGHLPLGRFLLRPRWQFIAVLVPK
jgi:SAM-dependent methyltransferase